MTNFYSDLTIFDKRYNMHDHGIKYYLIPEKYPLFKAHEYNEPIIFSQKKPSFFGIKNTDPEYIASYEHEYGIIYEYETTKTLQLIALDDDHTKEYLYSHPNANESIKKIIENNYGLKTKKRESQSEKDRELSRFICSLGYDGYATNKMDTDFGGIFHEEIMLCDANNSVRYVGRITKNDRSMSIIQNSNLKKHAKELQNSRKKKRKTDPFYSPSSLSSPTINAFNRFSSPSSPPAFNQFSSPSSPPAFNRFSSPSSPPVFNQIYSSPLSSAFNSPLLVKQTSMFAYGTGTNKHKIKKTGIYKKKAKKGNKKTNTKKKTLFKHV